MIYRVYGLTTELADAPLGMDEAQPRFGWKIDSDIRGVKQTAYRITVRTGSKCVWDSGRVESSETAWIEYGGEPLVPRTEYAWQVESFCDSASGSACSGFETGLMDTSIDAWRGAKWIGARHQGLAARAKSIFGITLEFRMHGEAAGVIFGKNDPRLLDANKNDYGIAGENYIKYRVTRSGVLEVYRVGYCPSDSADTPIGTAVIEGFDPEIPHSLRIDVTGNNAYAYLDGARVDYEEREFRRGPDPIPGAPKYEIVPRQLNPAGVNDLTTYPLLCESGFFSEGRAEVLRYAISNLRPPKATLARIEAATPGPFADHVTGDRLSLCDEELTADLSNGGIPLLRREFALAGNVKRARLYATARGIYECTINGKEISDRRFEPGAGQYDKHLQYQVYDVTSFVKDGANSIDVALASGWWNESQTFTLMNYNYWGDRQSLLMMLVCEMEDGTENTIVTSPEQWLCRTDGPVRFAGWFYGEHYDARLENAAPDWKSAAEVATVDFSELLENAPFPRWPVPTTSQPELKASIGSPVKQIMTLAAKKLIEPRKGVYVYDMGQNMIGVPEITFRGRPGAEAVIRYGEVLYPDLPEYAGNVGMILTENYRDALSIDRYIFATDEKVTWSPRFTFHGYRYVEISGVDEAPALEDVKGRVLSSIQTLTGDFSCSDEMVNRLYSNIRWSQYANFLSIPTDCPQRNERMGWAGDAQVFSRTAVYNADVYGFLRRYLECTRDCQLPDGRFADISPVGGGFGGIEWGSAGVIVTYELFRQYGDKRIILENFAAMEAYMDFLKSRGTPGVLDNVGPLGDWLATDMSTDNPLLWNSIYYFDAAIMSEMAKAVGNDAAAAKYAGLAAEIKVNWNKAFVDPETGKTRALSGKINDTQASYAVPLFYGLFDDMQRAADRLAEKSAEVGYTVTTGFVGTGPLCPALCDGGHADAAYRILTGRAYPSWLYSVSEGATTIWERWNSVTRENGFGGNNSMNSFNHYSLGAVGAWMYAYCLGIRRGEGSWQRFRLQPFTEGLDSAEGRFDSIYGTIRAAWSRKDGKTTYRVTVPANTEAELIIPGRHELLGSGEYEFEW